MSFPWIDPKSTNRKSSENEAVSTLDENSGTTTTSPPGSSKGSRPESRVSLDQNFLKLIHDPKDAEIDIVAVHGLNPTNVDFHAEQTWTAENKNMWLRDFLPQTLPKARILLFGYNANVAFQTSTAGVREQAENLLNRLCSKRQNDSSRPLIFICHSLGGLVVKRALIISRATQVYSSIKNSTYCIAFFGTPHRGGNNVALGKVAAKIARLALRSPKNNFLDALSKDSLFADDLIQDFRQQLEDYYVLSFYETQAYRSYGIIVDPESATLGLPSNRERQIALNGNHSDICKFESIESPAYEQVRDNLVEFAKMALQAVSERKRLLALKGLSQDQLSLVSVVRTISNTTERLDHYVRDQKSRAILDWIFPLDLDIRSENPEPIEGTGKWLFELDTFKRWVQGKDRMIWWRGQPGAGKTIIASIIAKYLARQFNATSTPILTIFCNYNNRKNQTTTNLIRSMLRQLLTRPCDLPNDVKAIYKHCQEQSPPEIPGHSKWSELLGVRCRAFPRAFVLIDALDEKEDTGSVNFLDEIIKLQAVPGLCILITSRHEPPTAHRHFQAFKHMEVQAHSEDLKAYVYNRIDQEASLQAFVNEDPDLQEKIISVVADKCEGTFLLARFYLDILADQNSLGDVDDTLETLPEGLGNMYKETQKRIENQTHNAAELAGRVILWLAFTLRPLTLAEMQDALAIQLRSRNFSRRYQPHRDKITSVCGGLVTIDDESSIIRFVHYTAQEYFQRSCSVVPNPHNYLATTCIIYLSLDAFEDVYYCGSRELKMRLHEYPFLEYCAKNWGFHARQGLDDDGQQLALRLVQQDSKRENLVQGMYSSSGSGDEPRYLTKWHIVAYWGLTYLATLFPEKDEEIGDFDSYGRSALFYATSNGHEEMVSLLLKLGIDATSCNHLTKLSDLNSLPVIVASAKGYLSAVQRLLDVQRDTRGDEWIYHRALRNAASEGHTKIVRILAERLFITDQGSHGKLAMARASNRAAFEGHYDVVNWLIQNLAGVNEKELLYDSLIAASRGGHVKIVKLLLDAGVDVNCFGWDDICSLQAASQQGHIQVVELLIKHGAKVILPEPDDPFRLQTDLRNPYPEYDDERYDGSDTSDTRSYEEILHREFKQPLIAAAAMGFESIVQILLQNGADVNTVEGEVGNALIVASRDGNISIVSLLLRHGADINAITGGHTALSLALIRGHDSVVEYLIAEGANVSLDEISTRYIEAVDNVRWEKGHRQIVEQLFKTDADLKIKNEFRSYALLAASAGGCDWMIQRLLETEGGAHTGTSPVIAAALYHASKNGHETIVKRLIDHNAEVTSHPHDHEGIPWLLVPQTALAAASKEGHLNVIRHLLTQNIDNESVKTYYWEALTHAILQGREDTVRLLLDKASDLNSDVDFGTESLALASHIGNIRLVEMLLDLDKIDTDKPFEIELLGGNSEFRLLSRPMFRLFLNPHAYIHRTGPESASALVWASFNGHEHVVRLLLQSGADVDVFEKTSGCALGGASIRGFENIVKLLLQHNAQVNGPGLEYGNALIAASYQGHHRIVQMLLDAGADIVAEQGVYRNALVGASAQGYDSIVCRLLKAGADPNIFDESRGYLHLALLEASKSGHTRVVKKLIQNNADVNAPLIMTVSYHRGLDEETFFVSNALLAATVTGNVPIARLLLQNGADVNARGNERMIALLKGHSSPHMADPELLTLSHKPNEGPEIHSSAFLTAVSLGELPIVKLFLQYGANINVQGEFGIRDEYGDTAIFYGTALHAAAAGRYHHILRILLEKGATVNVCNVHDQTPLDMLTEIEYSPVHWNERRGINHDVTMDLLLEHGAKYSDQLQLNDAGDSAV